MQLHPDTIYTAHDSFGGGMHALGILERRFGRKVDILRGECFCPQPGCVAFVGSTDIVFPSRYLRILDVNAPPEHKAHQVRRSLTERMPWLATTRTIVVINLARANGVNGTFLDTGGNFHLTGFTDALENLCGYKRIRTDMFAHLSDADKREARIAQRRRSRQLERLG